MQGPCEHARTCLCALEYGLYQVTRRWGLKRRVGWPHSGRPLGESALAVRVLVVACVTRVLEGHSELSLDGVATHAGSCGCEETQESVANIKKLSEARLKSNQCGGRVRDVDL